IARIAATALYNVTTAVLMAWEASRLGNGRRLLLSRMVVEHRLTAQDPLGPRHEDWEKPAEALLLGDDGVALEAASRLVA
ncbi:MAG: DNA alkylation response protein, partial [Candidatus Binataceae bacterium]